MDNPSPRAGLTLAVIAALVFGVSGAVAGGLFDELSPTRVTEARAFAITSPSAVRDRPGSTSHRSGLAGPPRLWRGPGGRHLLLLLVARSSRSGPRRHRAVRGPVFVLLWMRFVQHRAVAAHRMGRLGDGRDGCGHGHPGLGGCLLGSAGCVRRTLVGRVVRRLPPAGGAPRPPHSPGGADRLRVRDRLGDLAVRSAGERISRPTCRPRLGGSSGSSWSSEPSFHSPWKWRQCGPFLPAYSG